MQKITFRPEGEAPADFYIVGQSVVNGRSYLLVTESEDGDADALLLRDDSSPEEEEALFTLVTEEEELRVCAEAFSGLLGDEDIFLEL